MMDYMAYERKMNSIYDMVGEGKYKVRKRICNGAIVFASDGLEIVLFDCRGFWPSVGRFNT